LKSLLRELTVNRAMSQESILKNRCFRVAALIEDKSVPGLIIINELELLKIQIDKVLGLWPKTPSVIEMRDQGEFVDI
jgi:hypothetical protein